MACEAAIANDDLESEAGCSVKVDCEAETSFESEMAFGKEAGLIEEIVDVVVVAAFAAIVA